MIGNFNAALSGMKAADTALSTASHNIANLDTPDFKRQMTIFSDIAGAPGMPGNGVRATVLTASNPVLEQRMAEARQAAYTTDEASSWAARLNDAYGTGGDISSSWDDLAEAASTLSQDPANGALKQNYLAKLNAFATAYQSLSNQFEAVDSDMAAKAELLQQENEVLRQGGGANPKIAENNARLTAIADVRAGMLGQAQQTLAALGAGAATALNNVAKSGYSASGRTGQPLLKTPPMAVQVSAIDDLPVSSSATEQNGDVMRQLADANIDLGGGKGSMRDLAGRLTVVVGTGANAKEAANTRATNEMQAVAAQYQDELGVSLETEVVNTIRAQRLYDACARVIAVQNACLGSLFDAVG